MTGMNAQNGRRMSRRAHISQSVTDILTTPVGSLVMRRNYGSLLPEIIDQPLNEATLLRARAASADAVVRWEKRLNLQSVVLFVEEGALTVELESTEADGSSSRLSVPLGLKGVMA